SRSSETRRPKRRTRSRRTRTARLRPVARAPSSGGCRPWRRRSAARPGPARGTARESARSVRTPGSWRARRAALLERFGHLRRHVVLVMLRKHLLGSEAAAGIEAPACDDTLPFLEEIGQHAGIKDRDRVRIVRDDEADGEAAGLPLDAAVLHHAAEPERALGRHLAGH